MILPFPSNTNHQINILILCWIPSFTGESLCSLYSFSSFLLSTAPIDKKKAEEESIQVHPMPNRRNISRAQSLLGSKPKKLRRLPHVFSRVLELPFKSDADVSISEGSNCFRFVAETDGVSDEFRAHTVHIHPGVIKVVIRQTGALQLRLDDLEIDMWRFRLPETVLPELVTAAFAGGKLIVTVPKAEDAGEGHLVLVQ